MESQQNAPNRLIHETSPYLLQHAHNPVDWYPWGEEAFERARREDKPILLSVGYSACHWCHVIAHESFEDTEIAAMLNADFVSVKVDKEERPDVDAVYMDAVQLASGSGGWPMTLLLTPTGEPFFAATYLPKEAKGGMMGVKELLHAAAKLWRNDRDAALRAADTLVAAMKKLTDRQAHEAEPSSVLCDQAVSEYAREYDDEWGGFGRAPKFPSAHNLLFLLKHYERTGHTRALDMVTDTLDAMYRGGIFDHIGGGFCRYSVDDRWLTPHFEKMLYDNALLLWAYAEAWRVTGKPLYKTVAKRTADYVLREMTSPEGAFYCAQDADAEGKEGAYYVLTPDEVNQVLGKEDGERLCAWYGITREGNFEGASIPNLIGKPQFEREDERLQAMNERLYEYRKGRMRLGLDDKVLTSWNALMIAALCAASRALDMPSYLNAAVRAQRFLTNTLASADGGLRLRYRDGNAKGEGVLADYAYEALALAELYALTSEGAYLDMAKRVAENMLRRFGDDGQSGLYLYSSEGERLVTRPKETWDGAMPSGNSCAALALIKLARLTGDADLRESAEKQLRFVAGAAEEHLIGHGFGLYAVEVGLEG